MLFLLYITQVQVFQDLPDDRLFVDEADDLHRSLAVRTLQGIDLPEIVEKKLAQDDRDAEYILAMGQRIEDILSQQFTKPDNFLGMA